MKKLMIAALALNCAAVSANLDLELKTKFDVDGRETIKKLQENSSCLTLVKAEPISVITLQMILV